MTTILADLTKVETDVLKRLVNSIEGTKVLSICCTDCDYSVEQGNPAADVVTYWNEHGRDKADEHAGEAFSLEPCPQCDNDSPVPEFLSEKTKIFGRRKIRRIHCPQCGYHHLRRVGSTNESLVAGWNAKSKSRANKANKVIVDAPNLTLSSSEAGGVWLYFTTLSAKRVALCLSNFGSTQVNAGPETAAKLAEWAEDYARKIAPAKPHEMQAKDGTQFRVVRAVDEDKYKFTVQIKPKSSDTWMPDHLWRVFETPEDAIQAMKNLVCAHNSIQEESDKSAWSPF